jgi:hypothetical protein
MPPRRRSVLGSDALGKKIYFFYPPGWLKEEMIKDLIENEYEAYAVDDHRLLFPLLRSSSASIIFINIDSGPEELEWEKYVRIIRDSELREKVQVGILSNNNSKPLVEKYVSELKTEAGYIILRQRTQDVSKAIYHVLSKLGAKGRRRFLRAECSDSGKATFNISFKGNAYGGRILDISSAGMACYFDDDRIMLSVGDMLPDIQLRLVGKVTTVSGRIVGVRQDAHRVYVVLFDEKTSYAAREKIHSFVYYSLSHNMNRMLSELSSSVKS